MLLRELPHLVIDGVAIAARAVSAGEAIIAVPEGHGRTAQSLELALRQRADLHGRLEFVDVPERYVSGQESALVNLLSGGPAKPTFGARPFEHGVRQRPTLVQNVETLAHLALIVRHGASWFRQPWQRRGPRFDACHPVRSGLHSGRLRDRAWHATRRPARQCRRER